MKEVLLVRTLPLGWSLQKAELYALIQALMWSKVKKVNIYTDCRYAFTTVYIHGIIHKEQGLLAVERKQKVKMKSPNFWLRYGSQNKIVNIHCKEHQKNKRKLLLLKTIGQMRLLRWPPRVLPENRWSNKKLCQRLPVIKSLPYKVSLSITQGRKTYGKDKKEDTKDLKAYHGSCQITTPWHHPWRKDCHESTPEFILLHTQTSVNLGVCHQ